MIGSIITPISGGGYKGGAVLCGVKCGDCTRSIQCGDRKRSIPGKFDGLQEAGIESIAIECAECVADRHETSPVVGQVVAQTVDIYPSVSDGVAEDEASIESMAIECVECMADRHEISPIVGQVVAQTVDIYPLVSDGVAEAPLTVTTS